MSPSVDLGVRDTGSLGLRAGSRAEGRWFLMSTWDVGWRRDGSMPALGHEWIFP